MHAGRPVLAAGRRHSLGVRGAGTVLCVGEGSAGECLVKEWNDIVGVATGSVHAAANTGRAHSVGLRTNGTVIATG